MYINKLASKDLSLDELKAKISWRYDFEKPPPLISKYPSYRNNLLIGRSNVIVRITTTAVLLFSSLCNFDPICNIVLYFLLVLNFATVICVLSINVTLLKKEKNSFFKVSSKCCRKYTSKHFFL